MKPKAKPAKGLSQRTRTIIWLVFAGAFLLGGIMLALNVKPRYAMSLDISHKAEPSK